jgi:hypothetical protein
LKKYDVVIARYKENLDWVEQLDKEKFNITIYNKGPNDIKYSFVPLKNIGRESHSFIYHIISNYNNLPEYLVLLQGHPAEHCNNVINIINMHQDEGTVVLSDHWISESVRGWYETCEKIPPGYPITYLKDVAHEFLGDEMPLDCNFGAGGEYIVSSNTIKNRPKEYYQKLLDRFEWDYLLPWHLERLALYIYGVKNIFVYQNTKMIGFK